MQITWKGFVLYASTAGEGRTVGFQNLTNGKFMFGSSKTVTTISDNFTETDWNGVLFGAIEAE